MVFLYKTYQLSISFVELEPNFEFPFWAVPTEADGKTALDFGMEAFLSSPCLDFPDSWQSKKFLMTSNDSYQIIYL